MYLFYKVQLNGCVCQRYVPIYADGVPHHLRQSREQAPHRLNSPCASVVVGSCTDSTIYMPLERCSSGMRMTCAGNWGWPGNRRSVLPASGGLPRPAFTFSLTATHRAGLRTLHALYQTTDGSQQRVCYRKGALGAEGVAHRIQPQSRILGQGRAISYRGVKFGWTATWTANHFTSAASTCQTS